MLRAIVFAVVALHALAGRAQEPSGRVYIRRIEFTGVSTTNDFTLRHELLQLEGAFLNTSALRRSIERLEALPSVASAVARLRPVPGSSDVFDIVIEIAETSARRYGFGGGYSEAFRTSLHAYVVNDNVFGTGQQIALSLEGSEPHSSVEVSYTQPHARPEGVSRTIALASRHVDRLTVDASPLGGQLDTARLEYGFELAPAGFADALSWQSALCRAANTGIDLTQLGVTDCVRESVLDLGVEYRGAKLAADETSSVQLRQWMADHGTVRIAGDTVSTAVDELALLIGWRRDTRDRPLFSERGLKQALTLRTALPGSDAAYYLLEYEAESYRTFAELWTLRLSGQVGYGAAYRGGTHGLPPYVNWLAGGPRTVRGYRESSLGPRDSLGRPFGGDLKLAGRAELMVAWPKRWRERTRAGFFYDAGNVFSVDDAYEFFDDAGRPLDYGFDFDELRHSAGVALEALIPFGLLRASYAVPLGAEAGTSSPFRRDELERFQIRFAVDF